MEIAFISGKGGTGKSSISAAFATLTEKVVLADCDVDAANLYLLFNPTYDEEHVYIAGQKAIINESLCLKCGLCIDYCRFNAIAYSTNKLVILETFCDGCKLCTHVCPAQAISMVNNDKSRIYSGTYRNGKMVYGRLAPGEENSGKLVNIVKDKAKKLAKIFHLETIVIDGPPGIGCPVISTITGVDHVVIVTEPTISGLHDLKRAVEITSKFNAKAWVFINKYDLNLDLVDSIEYYCKEVNIPIVCKIPFDTKFIEALVNCKSIIEYDSHSYIASEIKKAFDKISRS